MFNVGLSGSFVGVFPPSVPIPTHRFSNAVAFYKAKFRATTLTSAAGRVTLLTCHGFRLSLHTVPAAVTTKAKVRLQLPPDVDRRTVARALANGAPVKSSRAGYKARDPYHVTWTVA